MRLVVAISALLAGLAVGAGSATPAPAKTGQSSQVTLTPTADAYVSATARRRNFGRAPSLLVRGRPAARAYIQFDLRGLSGPVAKATLRVYRLGRSARTVRVRSSATGWSERRINFRNAPRVGSTVATTRVRRGRVAIDVTRAVRTRSLVSFAITASGRRALGFASSEAGSARRPQLVIEQMPATLIAAGDIADNTSGAAQTATLLDQIPGTVAALGDLAYENGSPAEFAAYYAPTWGRHYARTRPAPGNHEYQTPGAAGYFAYWGSIAGNPGQGYYSYDLGAWHVLSLNSNCGFIGGCGAGSPQEQWVRADLAAHPARCTLAYWHHPRFSGGLVGGSSEMQPIWQDLVASGADLVLVAHAHNYQRFAPMTATGERNLAAGIREFVVGTGGRSMVHATGPAANLEVSNAGTFGVLKLTLNASSYRWQFLPVAGATFTDSGSTACH
jgi:hypothetical protein